MLTIYNSPQEKTFKFGPKKYQQIIFSKKISKTQFKLNPKYKQCECLDQTFQFPVILLDDVQKTTIKDSPVYYILEYYVYGIIELPKKVDKSKNITRNDLLYYPELLFPEDKISPTIVQDYVERYIPDKLLSYDQTLKFKLSHSSITFGIPKEIYLTYTPQQFLEFIQHNFGIETEKKSFLEQTKGYMEVIECDFSDE